MSVRMTQTDVVATPEPVDDHPASASTVEPLVGREGTPGAAESPIGALEPPEPESMLEPEPERQESESRRQLRQARHHRRKVSVACAVLVGVCLALTILVVTLASQRKSDPQGSLSLPTAGSASTGAVPPVVSFVSTTHRVGAPAPEGGHP